MTSRRRQPRKDRVRKRLQVRFGMDEPLRNGGFTTNLSSSGLGLSAPTVFPVGTRLTLRLSLPYGRTCDLAGVVAWSLVGAASMGMNGQMGLRVESRGEAYDALLASMGLITAADRPTQAPAQATPRPKPKGAEATAAVSTAMRRRIRTNRLPRFSGRLPAFFGDEGELVLEGVSLDLSSSGLSIVSRFVAPAGSDIAVMLRLPDGCESHLAGQVMWTRIRPLVPGLPNGMGLRLTSADTAYLRFVRGLARRSMLVGTSPEDVLSSPQA